MKYARLTKEQFEIFHERFSQFLATQKIDKDAWKKIVETDSKTTEEQLDLFSDIVWEDALSNAEYMEHVSEKDLKVFRFFKDKDTAKFISVKINGDLGVDFTSEKGISKMFENIMDERLEIYQGEKNVLGKRNAEMFQLITEGCMISDDRIFSALNESIS